MKRLRWLALAAVLASTACLNTNAPTAASGISDAFLSLPVGYSSTDNTFSNTGTPALAGPWVPAMLGGGGPRGGGPGGGPGGHDLGCGGLGPDFLGGIGFGPGFDHGPFGLGSSFSSCAYSASTGRVTCPPETHNGLTINRSASFTDASGHSQSAPDSATTNTINNKIDVSGTVVRHDGDSSTVHNSSDRTVTGLASGSTQRTVNGTSQGQESTVGTSSSKGPFTATRLVADTTINLVVPVQSGHATFPTSGKVIRVMNATVTLQGQAPANSSRREVITYDGSGTAKIVITQDGTTKTCSLPLPHGPLSCS